MDNFDERALYYGLISKGLLKINDIKFDFQEDKGIVLASLRADINNFKLLTNEQRDNEDVVETAVEICGLQLEYASDRLRSNPEIIQKAMKSNPRAVEFVISKPISKSDTIEMLQKDGMELKNLSYFMRNDKVICLEALNQNPLAFEYVINKEIKYDRELIIALLNKEPLIYQFMQEHFKYDIEMAVTALSRNKEVKKYIPIIIWEKLTTLLK
jgi:hypothetical protein